MYEFVSLIQAQLLCIYFSMILGVSIANFPNLKLAHSYPVFKSFFNPYLADDHDWMD